MPAINANSSGNNQLVAGVQGKSIRVLNYTLVASATVTVKFVAGRSAQAGGDIDLTGPMDFAANDQHSAVQSDASLGLFETEPGASLELNLGGSQQVGGHFNYRFVDRGLTTSTTTTTTTTA